MIYFEALVLTTIAGLSIGILHELQALRALISRSPQHLKYGKVFHRTLAPLDVVNQNWEDPANGPTN